MRATGTVTGIVPDCRSMIYHKTTRKMQLYLRLTTVCDNSCFAAVIAQRGAYVKTKGEMTEKPNCKKNEKPLEDKEFMVREDGCYMKDYVIDSEGKIVKTYMQFVKDEEKSDKR